MPSPVDIEKFQIIRAAAAAHAVAGRLAFVVRSSDVPPEHWEEVIERLKQLLLDEQPKMADLAADAQNGSRGPV
jgi:hypothetical protein